MAEPIRTSRTRIYTWLLYVGMQFSPNRVDGVSVKDRIVVLTALLFLCSSAHAFRSTKVESSVDPDYRDFHPTKIVLVVENASQEARGVIEERIIEELGEKGVEVIANRKLFLPTRQYTPEDRLTTFQKEGIQAALVVTIGAAASSVMAVATQTWGTANIQPSGQGYHASGTSTAVPIYNAKSKAEFSAVLFDVSKNRTAWYADVLVKAQGTLFVGEKGDAKGLVKGVIEGLEDDGIVAK